MLHTFAIDPLQLREIRTRLREIHMVLGLDAPARKLIMRRWGGVPMLGRANLKVITSFGPQASPVEQAG
jgi:hypothetical protein